ncbi:MAG: LTA synthase family protein [Acidobacteria bacterium]|nr:LTA synthase family protein [Acidobacteriota bacterium]
MAKERAGRALPWTIAILAIALWTLSRLVLFGMTGPSQAGWGSLPFVMAKGLWFDLATAAWLIAPFLLLHALVPNRWRASRAWGAFRVLALWACLAFLLFVAVAEVTFWIEFSTRFNFIAVDYLIYTTEVLANIRQSYPMGPIFGGIALGALGLTWVAIRFLPASTAPLSGRRRLVCLGLAVLLPAASLGLSSIDQMEHTGNAYADELSGNGLFTFFAAYRRNGLDYDRFYRTLPQAECDRILAGLGVPRQPLTPGITAPALPTREDAAESSLVLARPKNVVLISVESLSAVFMGGFGGADWTPNLDRIGKEGVTFTRLFATGTRTVRGLEALSLGTPPIPGQAIVRRPGNTDLTTLGGFLARKGYDPMFLYGGYGYFDNMNAYFAANHYRTLDRSDFKEVKGEFANAWGVADEYLYKNAMEAMDADFAKGKRFLAHIMTTSNHRPFTYPDGRVDVPSPGGREGSVKYTDWAIGRFIEQAKAKPWFKDTLFVIVADHCASAAGNTTVPVAGFHIPLILYGPSILKPGVDARLCSQMDIAPTLLDLLGVTGESTFFGRSLFKQDGVEPRALIASYQDLGYYSRGILTVLKPKREAVAYRVDPNTFAETPIPLDPRLLDEAIAYYETGTHAFDTGALKMAGH